MKGIYFNDWAPPHTSPTGIRSSPPFPGFYIPPETDQSLVNLSTTGPNWIAVSFQVWQENISSTQITYEPPRTATESQLQRVIDLAHSLGLRVLLMPLLHLSNDPTHGHIFIATTFTTEQQWQDWFASYRDMIKHYATFAQEVNVDMLFIGNELGGTTHREADWRQVISEVRQRFMGPITYDSLCDGPFPSGEYLRIKWWDAVDYIGVGGYFSLTNDNNPTVAELKEAWMSKGYIAALESLTKKFNKPLIISEIGYQSKDGTNRRPAGYKEDGPLDLQEQADCYQAAMEVFLELPWIKGIFWFQWFANPRISPGGPNDKEYTPYGKPAEEVLRKFYLSQ